MAANLLEGNEILVKTMIRKIEDQLVNDEVTSDHAGEVTVSSI